MQELESISEYAGAENIFTVMDQVDLVIKDEGDKVILACALAAVAEYLVTGDSDFLGLTAIKKMQIVTPAQFLAFF